jgi:hypothetical protein
VFFLDYILHIVYDVFKGLLTKGGCAYMPTTLTDISAIMASSLFVVGEIGGVDYIGGLVNKKSLDEMKTWVPYVVSAIISAVDVTSFLTFVQLANLIRRIFFFFAVCTFQYVTDLKYKRKE